MSEIARAPVPDSLLASTLAFLKRYPPFDRMEHDALAYLASRLSTSYHAAGSSILRPAHGKPEVLYIVRSAPVSCPPHCSIAEVLRTMHEARIGSMVVVDAHDAPVGIRAHPLRTCADLDRLQKDARWLQQHRLT